MCRNKHVANTPSSRKYRAIRERKLLYDSSGNVEQDHVSCRGWHGSARKRSKQPLQVLVVSVVAPKILPCAGLLAAAEIVQPFSRRMCRD